MTWDKIKSVGPPKAPAGPVVPCLSGSQKFVWRLHPVQLCDDCVAHEYAPASHKYAPASHEYAPASHEYAPASHEYAPASHEEPSSGRTT